MAKPQSLNLIDNVIKFIDSATNISSKPQQGIYYIF